MHLDWRDLQKDIMPHLQGLGSGTRVSASKSNRMQPSAETDRLPQLKQLGTKSKFTLDPPQEENGCSGKPVSSSG